MTAVTQHDERSCAQSPRPPELDCPPLADPLPEGGDPLPPTGPVDATAVNDGGVGIDAVPLPPGSAPAIAITAPTRAVTVAPSRCSLWMIRMRFPPV